MRAFVCWLKQYLNIPELELNESWSESIPFRKIRIRVKTEIIMIFCKITIVRIVTMLRWDDAFLFQFFSIPQKCLTFI